MLHRFRAPLALAALLLLCSVPSARTQSAAPASRLQLIVDQAVAAAREKSAGRTLRTNQIAVTLVDLRDPARPAQASHRGAVEIYPASVIKLFYLAAAHRWLEEGKLTDTPELRRAMSDMIVHSYNEATHYVVDVLTGTTSGPELPDAELKEWFEKRNAVNRHFAALGYRGVNANKKPWCEGPYGRESQAIAAFTPKRNALSTDATARLLVDIATGQCISAKRSAEMLKLLARNPAAGEKDADTQARFTGPALPPGAKLWSKAGWTSQTRHDAAYIELPDGNKFVLVAFTTDHAGDREIIATVARSVVAGLQSAK